MSEISSYLETHVIIKLSWNKDDNKLPYKIHEEFIKVFTQNNNNYKFYSYDIGGHEFNPKFIREL
jgi:predicted esterase